MKNFRNIVQSSFRFCPLCGARLKINKIHGQSELFCPKCNFVFWLNSKPTASGLLVKNKKVLLVKRGIQPHKGWWDVPGGFLDFHEKPEIGLVRELKEELNIKVSNPKFLGIYLGKYFSNPPQSTFNLYYVVTKWTGELRPADDVVKYKWCSINQLPKDIAFENNRLALKDLKKLLK